LFPLTLLFKKFLKLGATAYGGPAMMAQMKKAIVKDLGWLKEPEFMQAIALSSRVWGFPKRLCPRKRQAGQGNETLLICWDWPSLLAPCLRFVIS
jgi:hypothetical protein